MNYKDGKANNVSKNEMPFTQIILNKE